MTKGKIEPAIVRFNAKYTIEPNDCWLWTAALNYRGYAMFKVAGRTVYAHRWAYEHHTGPIPPHLPQLDHLCNTPACVNPAHLEPVTNAENMRRRAALITHCVHGHEFTPANTYHRRDNGCRQCRQCWLDRRRPGRRSTPVSEVTRSPKSCDQKKSVKQSHPVV